MLVQVLKKYDDWERRTGYFRRKKEKMKFVYLDNAGNNKLRTSLIAFVFGVLVNVGKKVVHL